MMTSDTAEEAAARRLQDRDRLRRVVAQWNANRLDLFELSEPDDNLEFHGVMRFYYQDAGQKVATKCIRVSSLANAQDVVHILIEKFRPDMRMLSTPRFALYEIHESGGERALEPHERPLYVQLNWHQDDLEGRFLLRNLDEPHEVLRTSADTSNTEIPFKRKLSKREKKELKKQEKVKKMQSNIENDSSVAEKLYTELPETSFTRSISNPEAVMRRRRQQKLEKKLQQFRSRDGGPDTGGTLKIYGESLCQGVPYKTLLLSVSDTAASVVREMLNKYGLFREDPSQYCLVQMVTEETQVETNEYGAPHGPYKEYILDDSDCPLSILMNHTTVKGSIMFHVRRRPVDQMARKRKKKPQQTPSSGGSDVDRCFRGDDQSMLPFLIELNPDGSDVRQSVPQRFPLQLCVTEVGGQRSSSPLTGSHQCLQLLDVQLAARHCVLAHTEGIVTVTPCNRQADTYVNGKRVYETTILQHGCVIQFGRVHKFRFIDPTQEERIASQQVSNDSRRSLAGSGRASDVETTFDVDGHVETHSTAADSTLHSVTRPSKYDNTSGGCSSGDPILPAVLEFREETEENFLRAVITHLQPSCLQFKLAPTYTLYMAARFRASTHYRPDLSPMERAVKLTDLLSRIANMIFDCIQARSQDANYLAFWMANSSEYLHFLKQDRHICAYSRVAQDVLAECVQTSFWCLVDAVQKELSDSISNFMEDRDDIGEEEGTTSAVLSSLGNTMALLRRCRVNAALTIQLFSQLFHYINMRVFNLLVKQNSDGVTYCTRLWGVRLKRRLNRIEEWADKLGLELAADCHLARVVQASHLLTAPKNNVDDLTTISSTCYKLNSVQLRCLLQHYCPAADEPSIPQELIDNIALISENTSDELARQDGRSIQLQEDLELQLPFLLPEDGYSCDIVRGIPNGLSEFIAPLQHAGMVRMSEQSSSCGFWTIYMTENDLSHVQPRSPSVQSTRSMADRHHSAANLKTSDRPEVQLIRIHKSNTGMGLSIVAAKAVGGDRLGIYIKSVVPGGAADSDGRLTAGDQLLSVDDHSLIDLSQEEAAEYMMRTDSVVCLRVAKQAAVFHGLTALLAQPSPVSHRGSRHARNMHQTQENRIHSSKSVPALYSGSVANGHATPIAPSSHVVPPSTGRVESHNPAFSLSASSASLSSSPWQQPQPSSHHSRAQSVHNLGAAQQPPASSHPDHAQLFDQQSQSPLTPVQLQQSTHASSQLHQNSNTLPSQLQQHTNTLPSQLHQSTISTAQLQHPTSSPAQQQVYGGMARSVSEHDHLRYRPSAISSRNNLLPTAESPDSSPHSVPEHGSWSQAHHIQMRPTDAEITTDQLEPTQSELLELRFQERVHVADSDDTQRGQCLSEAERRAVAAHRQQQMRRKQAELEAALQAEQRLLREAQKRRQQLEEQGSAPGRRLDSLLAAGTPLPPQRNVSFGAVRPPAVPPKPEVGVAAVVSTRRVQFSEPPSPGSQPNGAPSDQDGPVADPDVNTMSTPGVIGAQEVYRDPRTRRLAQMENRQRPDNIVPEQLTFREKMKMFATESGDASTRDKMKTSSRQRELEMVAQTP